MPSSPCGCSPLQSVSPSFVQPAEQSPHRMLPSMLMHSRSSWQPPFSSAHSSTSAYANKPATRLCVPDNNITSQSQHKSKIIYMIANGAYLQTHGPHVTHVFRACRLQIQSPLTNYEANTFTCRLVACTPETGVTAGTHRSIVSCASRPRFCRAVITLAHVSCDAKEYNL